MSCHDIGRGLNTVSMVVIDLYDHGEISVEAARKLLHQCRKGVHWCDGNEYEAVACCYENRCGYCLKKLEPGTPLLDLFSVIRFLYDLQDIAEYNKSRIIIDCVEKKAGYDFFCEDCLARLLMDAGIDKEKVLCAIEKYKHHEDPSCWSVNKGNYSEEYCKQYYAEKDRI